MLSTVNTHIHVTHKLGPKSKKVSNHQSKMLYKVQSSKAHC
jgi:hypothetical protein